MRKALLVALGLAGLLAMAPAALGQARPYIGFAYPAGGQQGTTVQVRLGGQIVDDVDQVMITGTGVSARVVECRRRMNPQELQLLREQVRLLRQVQVAMGAGRPARPGRADNPTQQLITKIEQRMADFVARPACAAIAGVVIIEVAIAADAAPGRREMTVATSRGVSNALVFHVGQLPETNRKPMGTTPVSVLGKERLSLRTRPPGDVEQVVTLPCTLNGQIAPGEVNRYRFEARRGQRLVISAEARGLVPFIADAVPGWFQPVMTLYDSNGKEVAYDDDYRFRPDPVILYEVPKDGQYVLAINDAIYRGREDFVYRITIGQLPFITSIFPLGGRAGAVPKIEMKGWNLADARLTPPRADAAPGTYAVTATAEGLVSNPMPFKLGTLPECLEQEPNNDPSHAQKVALPIVINGRIDRPDDWDVFQFTGQAGQTIVAEVEARRLDSPLDSFLKITDASGNVLAFNDDHADPEAGVNTHDADSYITLMLPASGTFYVHVGDTARHGGEEYAYRLRISPPQPDFTLRIVPSSLSMRSRSMVPVSVQVIRKEGFDAPIQLTLKNPPVEFTSPRVSVAPTQTTARLTLATKRVTTNPPVIVCVEGIATIQGRTVSHVAVPAEDRMQAFLWRHLVPAQGLAVMVFDPMYQPPPKRPLPLVVPPATATPATVSATTKPAFTRQQVASRLRQLKLLYEEGLLTDEFYKAKVLECEAAR